MYRFTIVLWVLMLLLCGSAIAQPPKDFDPGGDWDITKDIIRESFVGTSDYGAFGEDIVREIMTQVIELPSGEVPKPPDPVEILIKFKVRVFEIPEVPTPDEVDICWEICPSPGGGSFLDCYINCAGPGMDIKPVPPRTCDDIRKDFMEATTLWEQLKYLRELIKMGCIKPETVKVEIPTKR